MKVQESDICNLFNEIDNSLDFSSLSIDKKLEKQVKIT